MQTGCGLSACETIRCYKDEKIYLRHTNLKHSSHFTEDKETVRIENVVRWCKKYEEETLCLNWVNKSIFTDEKYMYEKLLCEIM